LFLSPSVSFSPSLHPCLSFSLSRLSLYPSSSIFPQIYNFFYLSFASLTLLLYCSPLSVQLYTPLSLFLSLFPSVSFPLSLSLCISSYVSPLCISPSKVQNSLYKKNTEFRGIQQVRGIPWNSAELKPLYFKIP
jgi:hypothetical protein